MRPVVVLGLMGAGKSSVAGGVAAALRRPLRDSDVDLEAATGRTAADLARESVEALHALEARHLLDALTDPAAVVAAAASTVEDDACRAALAGALVVWLDAPTAVLAPRFAGGAHRPRFGRGIEALLAEQTTRRVPLFEQVADLRLDARSPVDELVDTVCAALDGDRVGGRP